MGLFIITSEEGGLWTLPNPPAGWYLVGSGGTGWAAAPHEYQYSPLAEQGDPADDVDPVDHLRSEMNAIMAQPGCPVTSFLIHEGSIPLAAPDPALFERR